MPLGRFPCSSRLRVELYLGDRFFRASTFGDPFPWAAASENALKPTSVSKMPARITNRPIKMRSLRNPPSPTGLRPAVAGLRRVERLRRTGAGGETDFFFIIKFVITEIATSKD